MENKYGVNTPIVPSQTFPVADPRIIADCFVGGMPRGMYIYGRFGHPNYEDLSRDLLEMEGVSDETHDVLLFSSGLAASAILFLSQLDRGDHMVVSSRLYGGSRGQIAYLKKKIGFRVTVVELDDEKALHAALSKKRTKMLYAEVVSNPDLCVANVKKLAALCHGRNDRILLAIDNTFTPVIIQPFLFGADIVLHSLTKFVSGDSDVMGGALIGEMDIISEIKHPSYGAYPLIGAVLHPPVAQDLSRRFSTLEYRVTKACKRAAALAMLMSLRGLDVRYPLNHKGAGRSRMEEMGTLYGGAVVSIGFSTEEEGVRFTQAMCQKRVGRKWLGIPAVSLGSSHTYAWCFTKARVEAMQKVTPLPFAPIPFGFVRIAVGHEGNDHQFIQAFASLLEELGYRP